MRDRLCMRLIPLHRSEGAERLRDRLAADGAFYLPTASANGKRYLRLIVAHPETAVEEIRRLIGPIRTLLTAESRGVESRSSERRDEG